MKNDVKVSMYIFNLHNASQLMQGKSGSLGVGRGRAAMRGKVSYLSLSLSLSLSLINSQDTIVNLILFVLNAGFFSLSLLIVGSMIKAPATGRGTGGRGAVPPVRR